MITHSGRPGGTTGLTDRLGERHALDRLVDAVRAGESQALVMRGEPGVGKTVLLDYLARRASDAACLVTRATGVQSEMELAFAGLHQLCAPILSHAERLPGPQRDALRTAFGLTAGPPPDRFLVGLAVLSLLSEVAGERPLIGVIDDVQWLDQASAQTLGFAARRLAADPVGLVFAARDPGADLTGLPELEVGGLQDHDARALLEAALTGPLDARVRDLIIAETHGNPLALLELPRGLTPAELAGGFGLPGAQPERQLQQRQRVAARLGDDQVADPRIQRPGQRLLQQRPRVVVLQPADFQLGQPGQVRARIAGCEDQPDRVGRQPPRREPQRLRRCVIQPLLVIDQADQRPLHIHLRQQALHGQPDQEPVWRRPGSQPERGPQRLPLRHWQLLGLVQHRRAQLMQTREGQLHLRLHASRARHPASSRPSGHVIQQHGLAYARVAVHHQGPALSGPGRLDKPVEHLALASPVCQPFGASPGHRGPTGLGWARMITLPPSRLGHRLSGRRPGA